MDLQRSQSSNIVSVIDNSGCILRRSGNTKIGVVIGVLGELKHGIEDWNEYSPQSIEVAVVVAAWPWSRGSQKCYKRRKRMVGCEPELAIEFGGLAWIVPWEVMLFFDSYSGWCSNSVKKSFWIQMKKRGWSESRKFVLWLVFWSIETASSGHFADDFRVMYSRV